MPGSLEHQSKCSLGVMDQLAALLGGGLVDLATRAQRLQRYVKANAAERLLGHVTHLGIGGVVPLRNRHRVLTLVPQHLAPLALHDHSTLPSRQDLQRSLHLLAFAGKPVQGHHSPTSRNGHLVLRRGLCRLRPLGTTQGIRLT